MKKMKWVLAAMAAVPMVWAAAAQAAEPYVFEVGEVTLRPFISDRLRVEVVDWFDPGTAGVDGDYTFVGHQIRFGTKANWRDVDVTIEGEEVQLFGVPSDAPGLGPGGAYYASTAQKNQREMSVRQAVLQWSNALVDGLRVSGGRYLLNEGLESLPKDGGLLWLKKARISQRLVGAFDYTHVGRSFDGGSLNYANGPWDLTIAGGRPTAGGFNISANNEVEEVGVFYAAGTLTEPSWFPRSDARLFYLYYADDRDLVAVDNRPLPARQLDSGNIAIHTVGANIEKVMAVGPGDLDLLLWAAGQGGQWESLDHAAWALSVEAGYHFVNMPTKPWLRTGWFRGSGDDDPLDGNHDTFFQVLPTARLYAMTPFFNLMNNQDVFLQLMLAPFEDTNLRMDWHHLWVSEDQDLLYAGGGATQTKNVFGYGGFAAGGHSVVGDLLDIAIDYKINSNAKVSVYYGHGFGGSVITNKFAGSDDLNYAYFELTLSL